MGKIIASCGHELTDEEDFGFSIHTEGLDRENNRCLNYSTVCKKCYDWYKKAGTVLSEEEVKEFYKI